MGWKALKTQLDKLAQRKPRTTSVNWDALANGDCEAFYRSLPEEAKANARLVIEAGDEEIDPINAEIEALEALALFPTLANHEGDETNDEDPTPTS